jgi:bifunctional DNA-binding transcriptional regulator/antitoxin component of YhaV-PrlF toxin-antitoxin module
MRQAIMTCRWIWANLWNRFVICRLSKAARLLGVVSKAFLPYLPGMNSLTVTAKGQVTLRKDLLKHLGVQPGDKLAIDVLPDGRIQMKAARPAGKISDVFGLLKKRGGPHLSIEQINEATRRGWAGRRR